MLYCAWASAESYSSLLALGPRSAMVTYAAVAAALHPGPVLSFGENSSGFAMKINFGAEGALV